MPFRGAGILQGIPEVMAVVAASQSVSETAASNKRRREESNSPVESQAPGRLVTDNQLRHYDAASPVVTTFLRGPPLPHEAGERPRRPPTNRRRVDSPDIPDRDIPELAIPPRAERQVSRGSGASTGSGSLSPDGRTLSSGTPATSPTHSPLDSSGDPRYATGSSGGADLVSRGTRETDPFGYMGISAAPTAPTVYTGFRTFTGTSGPVNMFGVPVAPPPSVSQPNVFSTILPSGPGMFPGLTGGAGPLGGMAVAHARPVHPHAYVTVGAGMRQKEIDMYSAENPLAGISTVTGATEDGLVPYYVPM